MQDLQNFQQGKENTTNTKIFPENSILGGGQGREAPEVCLKETSQCSRQDLLKQASSFLTLLPGITEILFFYSLLPIVSLFLEKLDIFPNMVLAITGRMGYFKTTFARIAAFVLEQDELQEIPFYRMPKESALDERVNLLAGINLLIDDVFASATQYSNKRKADLFNNIVRYGDKRLYKTGIIITAEQIPEDLILSGRDRIFELHIPDLTSEKRVELWNRSKCIPKNLMAQITKEFVRVLEENHKAVIQDIEHFIDSYQYPPMLKTDLRIAGHVEYICLVEFLYRKYLCDGNPVYSRQEEFESALFQEAVRQYEEIRTEFRKQDINYTKEVYKMLNSGNRYLRMESNAYTYKPDGKNFFADHFRYYVTGTALLYGMMNYLGSGNVGRKKLIDALYDSGVLETDGSGARTQKTRWGTRHYIISRQMMETYCDMRERHKV